MKKILNKNTENVVEEMLSGYLSAYQKYYRQIKGYNAFQYRNSRKNKVVLVIGGGTGHEPLFSGFCGAGLADAVACGNICASPNPELIFETARAVDQGKGVLFLYGCYAGDNLNFDMAEKLCQSHGIFTAHVRVWDDFASAPKERKTDRRGIAGDIFVIKIAGAACDAGLSLEEVVRVTEKARDNINTIGVAISPGTLPGNEKPTFELADDEMEFGMGLHGEPGIERTKMMTSDAIVKRMYQEIQSEMNLTAHEHIAVLINGLGSTPLLELNLVYFNLQKHLKKSQLIVHDAEIKTYCTCMEMGGFSITILRLDDELIHYLDAPCFSPYYAKGIFTPAPFLAENDIDDDTAAPTEISFSTSEISRNPDGIQEYLTAENTRNMLLYVAQKLISQKKYLTEIDSAIGDGDHGIGMATGMQHVIQRLAALKGEQNIYRIFEEAGQAMLTSMGGASGVIFGSLFLSGSKDQKACTILTTKSLAEMEQKSLTAIQELGKARPGDKTMVDALYPAVEALKKNKNQTLLYALKEAEAAAQSGMESTKNFPAKFGRAKSLMERSIGHQDAGATSVYFIFQGMREFVEGTMNL